LKSILDHQTFQLPSLLILDTVSTVLYTLFYFTDIRHTAANKMLRLSLAVLGLMGAVTALPPSGAVAPAVPSVPDHIAAIMAVDPSTFETYQTGGLIRGNTTAADLDDSTLNKRACQFGVRAAGGCCASSPQYTTGDPDGGGWGVTIENGNPNGWEGFYFYENSCDYVVCTPTFSLTLKIPNLTIFASLARQVHLGRTRRFKFHHSRYRLSRSNDSRYGCYEPSSRPQFARYLVRVQLVRRRNLG
jgi:hypothetical protein